MERQPIQPRCVGRCSADNSTHEFPESEDYGRCTIKRWSMEFGKKDAKLGSFREEGQAWLQVGATRDCVVFPKIGCEDSAIIRCKRTGARLQGYESAWISPETQVFQVQQRYRELGFSWTPGIFRKASWIISIDPNQPCFLNQFIFSLIWTTDYSVFKSRTCGFHAQRNKSRWARRDLHSVEFKFSLFEKPKPNFMDVR
jgi:hypothetical protein